MIKITWALMNRLPTTSKIGFSWKSDYNDSTDGQIKGSNKGWTLYEPQKLNLNCAE